MFDQPMEYVRLINIIVAFSAFNLSLIKGTRLKYLRTKELNFAMGYVALLIWPLCYAVAAFDASLSHVEAGVWTAIMIPPIGFTFVASLLGWHPKAPASREPIGQVVSARWDEEGLLMEGVIFSDEAKKKLAADMTGMSIGSKPDGDPTVEPVIKEKKGYW